MTIALKYGLPVTVVVIAWVVIVRFLMGDIVSICPPLIITPAEIDELFDRLGRALDRTLDWVKHERLIEG